MVTVAQLPIFTKLKTHKNLFKTNFREVSFSEVLKLLNSSILKFSHIFITSIIIHRNTQNIFKFSKNFNEICSMNKKPVIAIDGFSSTGKSSISKVIAQKLRPIHIDTGALYHLGITALSL